MLMFSRKSRESILVAPDISIVVLSIGRSRVKLGFECPDQTKVVRAELLSPAAGVPHSTTNTSIGRADNHSVQLN